MKHLITGRASFIGSNLAQKSREHGNTVRVLDDFSTGAAKTQPRRFHAFFTTADPDLLDTVAADKTTAGTRSSNRSTPISRTPPWPTCHPAPSTPTPPGWCWQSSRSTSPAPPAPSPCPRAKATTATLRRTDHRASTSDNIGPPDHPAPPDGLALGTAWTALFDRVSDPSSHGLATPQLAPCDQELTWNNPDSAVRQNVAPSATHPTRSAITRASACPSVDRGLDTTPC